jgi:transcriptional regulator with XRE-family HTH domain
MDLASRLQKVLSDKGWQRADLVRESGESSSVVSQWLGAGSKAIKSIGDIETALRLEKSTGFSALWLAKGVGPEKPPSPASLALTDAIDLVAQTIAHSPEKDKVRTALLAIVDDDSPHYRRRLLELLNPTSSHLD